MDWFWEADAIRKNEDLDAAEQIFLNLVDALEALEDGTPPAY